MSERKKAPLTVEVRDGRLVIAIGIDTLAFAFEHSEFAEGDDFQPRFRVTTPLEFAREVERQLKDEEEDGTTLVHAMLDQAMERAIENGPDGVVEVPSAAQTTETKR